MAGVRGLPKPPPAGHPATAPADGARPEAPPRPHEPAPRRRLTAAAAITEELRDAIAEMRLLPGTPLVEKVLTERFGVSRTPVREALIRLAEEGLVDVRPQAGTFVGRIPLTALQEGVVVRQALEDATVALAVGTATDADFAQLAALIDRQRAFASLDDRASFHGADEAFHEAIAAISGHPGIWRLLKGAKLQVDRCRRLTLPALGRMDHVISEHGVILKALRARDAEGARRSMRAHLSAVLPDSRLLSQAHPEYFA